MEKHNIVATLIFAAFASVAVADHHKTGSEQTATVKEFEELRDRLNGRWLSDLKVNILWPKLGVKKGDTTTIFADYDADLDGMVLVENASWATLNGSKRSIMTQANR